MPDQILEAALADGVLELTMNRPEVLNSFNRELCARLLSELAAAERNRNVRAVLITGRGRGFSAGQDLAEMQQPDADDVQTIVRERYNKLVTAITGSRLPFICAVNGVAAGAGASIALVCDLVLAAKGASFVQAFVKIGLIPDTGATFFLPRLVGAARAKALALLGEKISAEDAERWGLIYRCVPAEVLLEEARSTAQTLSLLPPLAVRDIKRAFALSAENRLSDQLLLEEQLQGALGRTADFREGMEAFLRKRPPRFTGE